MVALLDLRFAPKSTRQSAIGVCHPRIAQKTEGTVGGSYNPSGFFQGKGEAFVSRTRRPSALLVFVRPCCAFGWVLRAAGPSTTALASLWLLQMLGLLAERGRLFANARQQQNLFYQSVAQRQRRSATHQSLQIGRAHV